MKLFEIEDYTIELQPHANKRMNYNANRLNDNDFICFNFLLGQTIILKLIKKILNKMILLFCCRGISKIKKKKFKLSRA